LIDLNKLTPPYALHAGQRLTLQPRGDYVVQRGDTVSGIAARQGVSISALIQLNDPRPPYTLHVGQRLILPTAADAPPAVAAPPPVISAPQPIGQPQETVQPQATPAAPQDLGGGVTASGLPPLQPAPQASQPNPAPAAQPAPEVAAIEPAPAPPTPKGDSLP